MTDDAVYAVDWYCDVIILSIVCMGYYSSANHLIVLWYLKMFSYNHPNPFLIANIEIRKNPSPIRTELGFCGVVFYTGVYQFLSAICPLKLQKLSQKEHKCIFVACRKMPILRALRAITKSCKKLSEIFNSRTGHHFTCSQTT